MSCRWQVASEAPVVICRSERIWLPQHHEKTVTTNQTPLLRIERELLKVESSAGDVSLENLEEKILFCSRGTCEIPMWLWPSCTSVLDRMGLYFCTSDHFVCSGRTSSPVKEYSPKGTQKERQKKSLICPCNLSQHSLTLSTQSLPSYANSWPLEMLI